jgi:hypothetical protein
MMSAAQRQGALGREFPIGTGHQLIESPCKGPFDKPHDQASLPLSGVQLTATKKERYLDIINRRIELRE